MKNLTTHVLDTMKGKCAAGMKVDVVKPDGTVTSTTLSESGRAVLVEVLQIGAYEIKFYVADYLKESMFFDVIPVRILVDNPEQHYHVPLILSAYGYSTYRGG